MEEIKNRMLEIEDPRHASYVKYALADILNYHYERRIMQAGHIGGFGSLREKHSRFSARNVWNRKYPI